MNLDLTLIDALRHLHKCRSTANAIAHPYVVVAEIG
jgi:hypothetical protein